MSLNLLQHCMTSSKSIVGPVNEVYNYIMSTILLIPVHRAEKHMLIKGNMVIMENINFVTI